MENTISRCSANGSSQELLRLLPRVLRARDFHLYLEGGKRLTDLWLYGGRALLGHKPPRVLVELKNAAERGLFAPLPHPLERRFIKALGEFFPGRSFRLYNNEGALLAALAAAGFGAADIPLWRPFMDTLDAAPANNESERDINKARILIPVLPWPLGPAILVLEKSLDDSFPPGELIPPVLLAPAARALYNLAAEMKAKTPNRGEPGFTKVEKALRGQKSGFWRRRGIYLSAPPDIGKEEYAALFRNFLEGGFLIPPSLREPLILPGSMSPGEEAKLAGLLELNESCEDAAQGA